MTTMQTNVVKPQHTREEELALKNKRTGLTIFQISWIMAFVCLIVVNWLTRYRFPSWPPPDVQPLSPILPGIVTIGLIASTFLARQGVRAIKAGNRPSFLLYWRLAIGLGVIFVAVMVYEWVSIQVTTQYGIMFRVMTAFHGVHALVIGIYMIVVYRHARAGAYSPDDFWAVEGGAKLWYFVTVAWLMFFTVLYLI